MRTLIAAAALAAAAAAAAPSCGEDEENAGRSCMAAGDCYQGVKAPLKGEVVCLGRVQGGYCTHLCQTDADCCAVDGECKGGLRQVCAPFESSGQKYCFLGCEPADIGSTEATAYCQEKAHSAFNCRSTGGGSMNRRVCVPGG